MLKTNNMNHIPILAALPVQTNLISNYKSILLLNMPKIGLNNPPMAPALLQAIAKEMGSSVNFLDINLLFQQHFTNDLLILNDWCELNQPLTEIQLEKIEQFTESLNISKLLETDIVGISVFSIHSFNYTTWFLKTYRSKIKAKIVVGGGGANVSNYGKELYDQGLVDYYVLGEGELPWRAILSNTLPYPGVNSSSNSLQDFNSVPVPDYTHYFLDQYLNSKVYGTTIGVEGSRGCVRNCTFCDIKSFWQKYKFKDGINLAEELITLKLKYNAQHFFFNDSLINGSDKAFRDFIERLSQYNRVSNDKIYWSGYFIIKSANTYKEHDWENLRDSGCKSLYIGIESGSEDVRNHMKKKFSNDDIAHTMSKIQLYGIRCTWLLIIGYPTETEKDFQDTLDMLEQYQSMAIDRTIDTVALGLTLGIIPGSPLELLKEELNIRSVIQGHTADDGIYWENDNSDFRIRVMRRIRAEKLIRELGYNSWSGDHDIISYFENKLDEIEQGIVNLTDDIAEYHG